MAHNPKRMAVLIGGVILAEIFSMAGFSTFAVSLVDLSHTWGLDSTRAGWISGAYFVGYVAAVPLLVGLTDRFDARRIYYFASLLGVAGGVGFAWLADGMAGAMLLRALAGASLAGTYMPGLRILTERLGGPVRLRVVPYYTASFGIGVSLSFLVSGWLAHFFDWRFAFAVSGFSCAAAMLLVALATAGRPADAQAPAAGARRHPLDLRPAFRNRDALAYILAYCGHCWELFALRAWLPAYLLFAWQRSYNAPPGAAPAQWSMLIVLIGVPASIIGAEVASQRGRLRLIRWIALTGCGAGIMAGLAGNLSYAAAVAVLLIYNFLVTADSGALTTGAFAAARPGEQGATLAVHSILGFLGGGLGPVIVGWGLDLGGGITRGPAWFAAFVLMIAGSAFAALVISGRSDRTCRKKLPQAPVR
ncbi:MAG: MFS transporter [Desulfobacteraceae bacterium]|nr:MAG: MFS transporter [Desulfobacteraceae bacterium]